MANTNVVHISAVPKDFDPDKVQCVFNPLPEAFTVLFGGVEVTIPSGAYELYPEHKAAHVAKHLADRMFLSGINEFLIQKFPGLDDVGREKWKMNVRTFYAKEDVIALAKQLLFTLKAGDPVPDKKDLNFKFKKELKDKQLKDKEEESATGDTMDDTAMTDDEVGDDTKDADTTPATRGKHGKGK